MSGKAKEYVCQLRRITYALAGCPWVRKKGMNVCTPSTQRYGCACAWLTHNGTMKLRRKLILLALAPLVLVLCMVAIMVNHQSIELAKEQREVIEPAYLASKQDELRS